MASGRPTKPLSVTAEEKEKLVMLAQRPKTAQALAMRARIVLGYSGRLSNAEVATRLRITDATVCKWRQRFRIKRLYSLLDESRPGAPRSSTDAQVEAVITKTLESMPSNSTHWSTRLMARKIAGRKGDRPDLACFWTTASSRGELQILDRPAIRRKSTRHRGFVPRSARSGDCPVRGREESSTGH